MRIQTLYGSETDIHLMASFTLNLETNLAHSCCQLCRVDAGAITRKGPQIPCDWSGKVQEDNHNDVFQVNVVSSILTINISLVH